jgi:hypothetical protein
MKFHQFWPLYLRAHSLPGTRAMHYFATAIGVMAFVEAIIAQEPWLFAAGIALAYGIAIFGHWIVEGNQPLIGVSPIWGAVSDLRMVWLAMTGRLNREYEKRGWLEINTRAASIQPAAGVFEFDLAARRALRNYDSRVHKYGMLFLSAVGLLIVLADLHDLIEPAGKPTYPIVQLGIPILAFATAVVLSYCATHIGRRHLHRLLDWFASQQRASISDMPTEAELSRHLKRNLEWQCAREISLRRASIVQFLLGAAIFAAAELAEAVLTPAL